jgi:hypothetical protein
MGETMKRTSLLSIVVVLALAGPAAAQSPTLTDKCEVVTAFFQEAVRLKQFPADWLVEAMPNPDDRFIWGRAGHWWGKGPPANSGLLDVAVAPLSSAFPGCGSDLTRAISALGGASAPAAKEDMDKRLVGTGSNLGSGAEISASLPIISADRREALLHYVSSCGVLCGGDFLAYLRRDRGGRWRLVGVHVMGD